MPGTPEEYAESPDTAKAAEVLDEAISQGKTNGSALIEALSTAGMRIYPESPEAEAMEEEAMPEDEMEEEGMEEEPMMDDEMPEPGDSMIGGSEGGNRAMLIEAVRFGLDKDKEKKDKLKKDEAALA